MSSVLPPGPIPCDPTHSPHPLDLLTVPVELRLSVYEILFADMVTVIGNWRGRYSPNAYLNKADDSVSHRFGSSLVLRACRQIYREALPVLNWQKTLYLHRGAHLSSVPRLVNGNRVRSIILRMQFGGTSEFSEFATALRPLCMPGIGLSNLTSLQIKVDPVNAKSTQYNSSVLRIGLLSALRKIQKTNQQLSLVLESASPEQNLISLKLAIASTVSCPGVSASACQRTT